MTSETTSRTEDVQDLRTDLRTANRLLTYAIEHFRAEGYDRDAMGREVVAKVLEDLSDAAAAWERLAGSESELIARAAAILKDDATGVMASGRSAEHACVKAEAMVEWAQERFQHIG